MEGYSVEDEGKGIKFNVFVYNVQSGEEFYNYESLPQNRENNKMTSIAGELIKSVNK